MGKRHPNLPAWQWRVYPHSHQHPTNLVLHLIAVPLFIVGFLLIASGVFSLSFLSLAIGPGPSIFLTLNNVKGTGKLIGLCFAR